MERLYLWLDLGSLALPLLFSFHPKIKFYKLWPSVLPGILVMASVFIPWDIYFTAEGFWGFNPKYLTGVQWLGLPMEEWLFFLLHPLCLFVYPPCFKLTGQLVATEIKRLPIGFMYLWPRL